MFKEFFIEENDKVIGSISGHLNISKSSFIIENYFCVKQKIPKDQLKEILKDLPNNVSILMNMYVDEDFQGKGYGKELIEEFLSYTTAPVILICDISEKEWIESFYYKQGFETVSYSYSNPIMLKK